MNFFGFLCLILLAVVLIFGQATLTNDGATMKTVTFEFNDNRVKFGVVYDW